MRDFFTRAIVLSFALFLMVASVTGVVSAFTGSTSTVAQSSPLGAVASAYAARFTRAMPTISLPSFEW
jgi:hypothetical protein